MPIYDMYPYSNLHELNLDFIIKLCEEFKDGVSDIEAQIQAVSDRVAVFEQAFTFLSTPDGLVTHLASALNVHGKLDVNGDIHAINGKVYTDGGLDGGLAEPVNITLTGDVEGTVSTDLKNDIEIQTTVVGGGGGGETLPKVIFDGTIQGQLMGELYVAQFPETLELVPGCRYAVELDGSTSIEKVEYHQSYNGYGITANGAAISYSAALLNNGNEHTLKITQVDNITKQLLYCATIPFADNGGNYRSTNDGYIPNLGAGDYTVVWDGVTYDTQSYIPPFTDNNLSPLRVYLGDPSINEGGSDPEYPFFFDGYTIYTNSTAATHSIAIYGPRIDSEEVILYAEDNPTSGINPLYGDPDQYYSFESAIDLTQYIQNKTPVIVKTLSGNPTSGKCYPLSYTSLDGEGVVIVVNVGGSDFSYGIGGSE